MYNEAGNPSVIASLFLQNNAVSMGGGVFNLQASPTISDCVFAENTSNKGAGMRNYINSHPTVTYSVFSYNHAGEEGGGMDNRKNSNPLVTGCLFIGNTAASAGGGMHNYVGNAVATGDPIITSSLFIGNRAPIGGAMRNNDPSPIITNSTFAYNEASEGAISSRQGSAPLLTNCIVWGNTGGSFSGDSAPTVSYSDIQGGFPGTGNLDLNPLFVSPAGPDGDVSTLDDNDYHLLPSSPLIDTGSNDAPGLPPTDLDGSPRVMGGTVDMGAYELVVPCAGDFDCDDGDLCTTNTCAEGLCVNLFSCDDGDVCTLDQCNRADGQCAFPPKNCDDGVACTIDSCLPADGQCVSTPTPANEVPWLDFQTGSLFLWGMTPDAFHWNSYRGTIPTDMRGSRLPGTEYDHACFESADAMADGADVSIDSADPPLREAFIYYATGEGLCLESIIGRDSSGGVRPNTLACPTPP